MNIKRFANDIANIHDTRNPFHIAAENDIHILYEELGKNLGYFSNLFRIKTIRINNHADPFLQPFICAHELGHALLHPHAGTHAFNRNSFIANCKIEKEANQFAVLINIGKLLNADYIVYSQFYIDKINAPGLFHTTMKFEGQTVLTIIDVHAGEYKYKISEDVNNGKLEDVSRSMFIVYDKSIADIKLKGLKF